MTRQAGWRILGAGDSGIACRAFGRPAPAGVAGNGCGALRLIHVVAPTFPAG